MQQTPANKMAKNERYPRGKDAFDRELQAIEKLDAAPTALPFNAAKVADAEAALKTARREYGEACDADDRERAAQHL